MSGPEVGIPFGALIEPVSLERGTAKFRYLGELYSVAEMTYLEATRTEASLVRDTAPAEPLADTAAAVAPAAEAAPVAAHEPRLKFEPLDAAAYAIARAKVPGGWLIAGGATLTFYPDPEHSWDGSSVD
jgi:hypothetical protein